MTEKDIERINELYHKSKSVGLTSEEAAEQANLRSMYIKAIRANLRGNLDQIDIREKDGSITHLKDVGKKRRAKGTDGVG
ncbi:MAG: DUF896 domain-containing protein [Lachnospiraceae bacterium]|nr:DUF896 domain-containing protein [Lachnospiraceae bacterium]